MACCHTHSHMYRKCTIACMHRFLYAHAAPRLLQRLLLVLFWCCFPHPKSLCNPSAPRHCVLVAPCAVASESEDLPFSSFCQPCSTAIRLRWGSGHHVAQRTKAACRNRRSRLPLARKEQTPQAVAREARCKVPRQGLARMMAASYSTATTRQHRSRRPSSQAETMVGSLGFFFRYTVPQ